jgi:hypothetical protein
MGTGTGTVMVASCWLLVVLVTGWLITVLGPRGPFTVLVTRCRLTAPVAPATAADRLP